MQSRDRNNYRGFRIFYSKEFISGLRSTMQFLSFLLVLPDLCLDLILLCQKSDLSLYNEDCIDIYENIHYQYEQLI